MSIEDIRTRYQRAQATHGEWWDTEAGKDLMNDSLTIVGRLLGMIDQLQADAHAMAHGCRNLCASGMPLAHYRLTWRYSEQALPDADRMEPAQRLQEGLGIILRHDPRAEVGSSPLGVTLGRTALRNQMAKADRERLVALGWIDDPEDDSTFLLPL